MKTYQDFCGALSQELFALIEEKGSLLSWNKSWNSEGSKRLPNGVGGTYRSSNLFMLLLEQYRRGYKSNQWFTFNQIKQQGGIVKKGAKGCHVYFWSVLDCKTVVDGEEVASKKPFFKSYYVFNIDQTTLLNAETSSEVVFSENAVDALIASLGITVSHFGGKAYYSPKDDVIVMPQPKYFLSRNNYYAVLLHELVHWTGGKENRLPRQCFDKYTISDKERAQEELVAEVGSLFLSTHFGLQAEVENHASYVHAWKTLLNEKEVMTAVNLASKAFAWILDKVASQTEKTAA